MQTCCIFSTETVKFIDPNDVQTHYFKFSWLTVWIFYVMPCKSPANQWIEQDDKRETPKLCISGSFWGESTGVRQCGKRFHTMTYPSLSVLPSMLLVPISDVYFTVTCPLMLYVHRLPFVLLCLSLRYNGIGAISAFVCMAYSNQHFTHVSVK